MLPVEVTWVQWVGVHTQTTQHILGGWTRWRVQGCFRHKHFQSRTQDTPQSRGLRGKVVVSRRQTSVPHCQNSHLPDIILCQPLYLRNI